MEKSTAFSTLFIVAHPYLEKSRANRTVTEAVDGLNGVTVRRLYDLYPYFHIDVAQEQKLLVNHDLIVFQHPFLWYSMPPLLKMWMDEVWQSGWAYGPGGDKLKGKRFLLSITTGGGEEAYSSQGRNRFSLETLLSPLNQTVHLCQMKWHAPRVIHGSIRTPLHELNAHAAHLRADLVNFAQSGVIS